MAEEIILHPGWLLRDAEAAILRIKQWKEELPMTTDIVERLTKKLDDLDWRPNRATIEGARNELRHRATEITSLRARVAELEAELRDAFVQLRMCRTFVSGHEQMTPSEQEQNDAVIASIEETLLGSKDVVAIARAEGRAQGIREAAKEIAPAPDLADGELTQYGDDMRRASYRILSLLPNEKEKS